MKTLVAFIFGTFVVFGAWAQEATTVEPAKGPIISFEEATFDFGDITQGDKVEHVFNFENTGIEPLIITNVQTTCGCTAPEWPRDPVIPGQKSSIKVVFNSTGKSGRQNKVITILSNSASPSNQITITTNVLPKKEGQ
ncbi:MAG: DUF1573 domain-containing protein [Cyclobacteriaceae bacterium]|nr:DUF1573 domain-containing protein [Cyclobacteriaceae bacterium]